MATKRYGSLPPYKAPLVGPDKLLAIAWLSWFDTLTKATKTIIADVAYDPPSIAAGAVAVTSLPVAGANLGDFATASFSAPNSAVLISAQVTAADTVSVSFYNISAGAIDLGAGTLRARVEVNA